MPYTLASPVGENTYLVVRGNIFDDMSIKTGGSLMVEGDVAAAILEAGKDIAIAGCVHGMGHACVTEGTSQQERWKESGAAECPWTR